MGKLTFHLIKKLTGVDIEQLQEDNNSLNIKTQQLSFDVKDANKEAAYKRTQLSEAQEELTKTQEELTKTQEELTKTQEELTQSQAAVTELQKNISNLQEEITRLQSGVTDLQKAKEAECDSLQQSNEQLANLKLQNEALHKEKGDAENRIKELEAEAKKLSDQLTALNAELVKANQLQKQQAEEAQKALAEAESKFSELQNSYSESQNSYSQLQKEKAEAEANANAKLDDLQNAFQQLQADKAKTETNIETQLKELQNEYKQLQADKAEAEANAQKQLRELQTTYQQLQNDNTAKSEENQSLKQQAEDTQKVLTEVEGKLSELQAGKEEAEADSQAVIAQLAELQRENALLKEQLAAKEEAEKLQEEASPTETAEEEQEKEAVAPEKESKEETTTETEEPEESETEGKEETVAAKEEAEKETEEPEQKEEEIAEQPKQEEPEPQPEKPAEQPKPKEEPAEHPTDIVEAYQEMKAKLEEATLKFPYTRITCTPDSRQYIYDSHTLGLKAELFVWGIEGNEMILDEYHFIPYDEIDQIEGLDTIYSTEQITNSVEDDVTTIAETLLAAICASRPVHVTYRDKNGRISEKNLYWLCFQPADKRIIRLPYDNMFDDMFEEKIDPEHIVAMSAHNGEPRIFIISQILSIQVFDCFFSNARGVKTITEAMRTAIRHEQPEAAEVIYNTLPDKLKETPKVVSSLANTYLLQGEYEKAVKLYLSLSPNQVVEGRTGWADYNLREFDELIRRGIEPEAFMQLKEALKEEGWE